MLLLALLAQLGLAPLAQAELTDDWSGWEDNGPNTGNPNTNNYGTNYQPNSDQTRMGTNGGNTITSNTAQGDWVGYTLYNYSNGRDVVVENKLASLTLNPQMQENGKSGTLEISSDLAAFNMRFNSADRVVVVVDEESSTTIKSFNYSGSQTNFEGRDISDRSNQRFAKAFLNRDTFGLVELSASAPSASGPLFYNNRAVVYDGESGAFYSSVPGGLFGKTLPAADIAYMVGLGNTNYSYSGGSALGSQVNISVNFFNASWNGTWGGTEVGSTTAKSFGYNGFQASGTINGATLASNSLIGLSGADTTKNVQTGVVKGTLVGIANASEQVISIIGATTLNVGTSAASTKEVNDVFFASVPKER